MCVCVEGVAIAERKRRTAISKAVSGPFVRGETQPTAEFDPQVEVAWSETDLFDKVLDKVLAQYPLVCPEQYLESLLSLSKMKFE